MCRYGCFDPLGVALSLIGVLYGIGLLILAVRAERRAGGAGWRSATLVVAAGMLTVVAIDTWNLQLVPAGVLGLLLPGAAALGARYLAPGRGHRHS